MPTELSRFQIPPVQQPCRNAQSYQYHHIDWVRKFNCLLIDFPVQTLVSYGGGGVGKGRVFIIIIKSYVFPLPQKLTQADLYVPGI